MPWSDQPDEHVRRLRAHGRIKRDTPARRHAEPGSQLNGCLLLGPDQGCATGSPNSGGKQLDILRYPLVRSPTHVQV